MRNYIDAQMREQTAPRPTSTTAKHTNNPSYPWAPHWKWHWANTATETVIEIVFSTFRPLRGCRPLPAVVWGSIHGAWRRTNWLENTETDRVPIQRQIWVETEAQKSCTCAPPIWHVSIQNLNLNWSILNRKLSIKEKKYSVITSIPASGWYRSSGSLIV